MNLKPAPQIFVDADACPVRDEVYKVAARHQTPVIVVSNSFLRIPRLPGIEQVVVSNHPDAADDYIAERSGPKSVVITADILLAERCLQVDAIVLGSNGKAFTRDSIGSAVATRALMNELRAKMVGENIGGPAPFGPKDRSQFLQALHEALIQLSR
jgi:uncharacterized protein YaiI (UPF0178 family)